MNRARQFPRMHKIVCVQFCLWSQRTEDLDFVSTKKSELFNESLSKKHNNYTYLEADALMPLLIIFSVKLIGRF